MTSARRLTIETLLLIVPVLLAAGCSKEPAGDTTASGPSAPAAAPSEPAPAQPSVAAQPAATAPDAAQVSALPPDVRAAADEALGAYEQLRSQLAADKTDGVTETVTRLEQAAIRAAAAAPGPLQARLQTLASSTNRLKEAQGKSADEVRTAFGDVSRAVVGLVSADPALAQGRHVFECPMAQGYKKWVQTSEGIANPYMGTKMLACGMKSTSTE